MLDFTLFDKALKIVWVKSLRAYDERPWNFIPLSVLSNENLSKLYWGIISHWQKINDTNPKAKGDV